MIKTISLKFKNGITENVEVVTTKTAERQLILKALDLSLPNLISIDHSGLNTQLECSIDYNAVMFYLDKDGSVTGASFISPSGSGTFGIITQAKQLLFISIPSKFDLIDIHSIH